MGENYYVFVWAGAQPCSPRGDNRDAATYVSALRARAGCDNGGIVPGVEHCHSGSARPGSQDRTRWC